MKCVWAPPSMEVLWYCTSRDPKYTIIFHFYTGTVTYFYILIFYANTSWCSSDLSLHGDLAWCSLDCWGIEPLNPSRPGHLYRVHNVPVLCSWTWLKGTATCIYTTSMQTQAEQFGPWLLNHSTLADRALADAYIVYTMYRTTWLCCRYSCR